MPNPSVQWEQSGSTSNGKQSVGLRSPWRCNTTENTGASPAAAAQIARNNTEPNIHQRKQARPNAQLVWGGCGPMVFLNRTQLHSRRCHIDESDSIVSACSSISARTLSVRDNLDEDISFLQAKSTQAKEASASKQRPSQDESGADRFRRKQNRIRLNTIPASAPMPTPAPNGRENVLFGAGVATETVHSLFQTSSDARNGSINLTTGVN